jgi:hypothetical protein
LGVTLHLHLHLRLHVRGAEPCVRASHANTPLCTPPCRRATPRAQVAEEIETQLQKYKAAVDEINAKTGGDHGDSNGARARRWLCCVRLLGCARPGAWQVPQSGTP